MDLDEIQDQIDDLRPSEYEAEQSVSLLMYRVGKMAEGKMLLSADAADEVDDDLRAETHSTLVGGVMMACVEYAEQHDVNLQDALDERVEDMREAKEKREEIKEALDEGDAAALADALDADANEVPTGLFEDDGDERGVY